TWPPGPRGTAAWPPTQASVPVLSFLTTRATHAGSFPATQSAHNSHTTLTLRAGEVPTARWWGYRAPNGTLVLPRPANYPGALPVLRIVCPFWQVGAGPLRVTGREPGRCR